SKSLATKVRRAAKRARELAAYLESRGIEATVQRAGSYQFKPSVVITGKLSVACDDTDYFVICGSGNRAKEKRCGTQRTVLIEVKKHLAPRRKKPTTLKRGDTITIHKRRYIITAAITGLPFFRNGVHYEASLKMCLGSV